MVGQRRECWGIQTSPRTLPEGEDFLFEFYFQVIHHQDLYFSRGHTSHAEENTLCWGGGGRLCREVSYLGLCPGAHLRAHSRPPCCWGWFAQTEARLPGTAL